MKILNENPFIDYPEGKAIVFGALKKEFIQIEGTQDCLSVFIPFSTENPLSKRNFKKIKKANNLAILWLANGQPTSFSVQEEKLGYIDYFKPRFSVQFKENSDFYYLPKNLKLGFLSGEDEEKIEDGYFELYPSKNFFQKLFNRN